MDKMLFHPDFTHQFFGQRVSHAHSHSSSSSSSSSSHSLSIGSNHKLLRPVNEVGSRRRVINTLSLSFRF